jgi:hypothetical protein
MSTRRHRTRKQRGSSRKKSLRKKSSSGKKWVTAIDAAQNTLNKTGSVQAARKSLQKQALVNAKKLFGSVSTL